MDIQRYLSSEPVVARPPSRLYRFQKLARRNKIVFAAGGAVAAALIIGLGVSTRLFFLEKSARLRAVAADSKRNWRAPMKLNCAGWPKRGKKSHKPPSW